MNEIEFAMIMFEKGHYTLMTKINLIAFLYSVNKPAFESIEEFTSKYELDDLIAEYKDLYCHDHHKITKMIGTPWKK